MIRTRFPRLAEAQHAKLAAELHLPWPPAYRAVRSLERRGGWRMPSMTPDFKWMQERCYEPRALPKAKSVWSQCREAAKAVYLFLPPLGWVIIGCGCIGAVVIGILAVTV